ncbi:hypothetical protein NE857_32680 [Nocardiopsis exhalans]|uniref:DNA-binding transcriptional activator of the SARP family n=1 Tax=Nocardiopsis exhalans TaxID=163604 RepID=A0ABY5D7E0_9ACTN|nr:hypothetical protein [Nocardiopsis exhalans]USY19927.1 hypothetical protein NE857_32680 [Nocardiopsis exhalans]
MNSEHEVQTLGGCRVDGVPVRYGRALELVAVLVLSHGTAPRDWLLSTLFEGDPAPSSLPTLALRARKLGLDVRYDRDRRFYHLEGRVRCDVAELLSRLEEGRLKEALELYRGPFLTKSHSPFAAQTRDHVDQRIVRAAIDSGDVALMEAADRIVKHPELSQELVRRGGDQISASLGRSWLMGLETAM